MAIRSIKFELEAKLKAATSGFWSTPRGKLERKSYADKAERLKIIVKNLRVPDNTVAVVTANGDEIARIPICNGSGRFDQESDGAEDFKPLASGQTIELRVNGEVILAGELYED